MRQFEPSYLKLLENGELERRVRALNALLKSCTVCPKNCKVDRWNGQLGFCLSGKDPYVTSVCDHHGEEPVLSGKYGSGTVFFGGCNLRCVFCQNFQISQRPRYFRQFQVSTDQLAQQLLFLQDRLHVHNINFVSPSHFVPQMVESVYKAATRGLRIPIVYNSNGYDSVEVLKLLDGIVDIYLPDFKYFDNQTAKTYSRAEQYVEVAKKAIKEMYRQVGNLQVDENGIAQRGLLIRHLILPNELAQTDEVLEWIARELSQEVSISLMAQYYPTHKAHQFPLLSRKIRYTEYQRAVKKMIDLGLGNGFAQHMEAPEHYLPDFEKDGHPFEDR